MTDITFDSPVYKSPSKGGWTYLVWPHSAEAFGTKGLVKVRGTFDSEPFESSFMAMGDSTHKLPITAATLKKLSKTVGDTVHVTINERI